jgi:hypothetical protein
MPQSSSGLLWQEALGNRLDPEYPVGYIMAVFRGVSEVRVDIPRAKAMARKLDQE